MKKLLQLGLILAGAAAFTMTAANAKCAGAEKAPKTMKCQSGKCGSAMKEKNKDMKCQSGKCGDGKKKEMKEQMKEKMKGKCGQGKCGS